MNKKVLSPAISGKQGFGDYTEIPNTDILELKILQDGMCSEASYMII